MSIETIVHKILAAGQITPAQEDQINLMVRQEECTDTDLCALDSLCFALISGKIRTSASHGQAA